MKKIITTSLLFGVFLSSNAQENTNVSNWRSKAVFGLNGSQSSFVNWNAGGRNNITVIGFIDASANYKKNDLKWDNNLRLALGGVQYIGVGAPKQLRKSDDVIDLSSNLGLKFKEHWYYSAIGTFKTQFLDGFNFPNDSVKTSTFLAPGYATFSLGFNYQPNKHLSVFIMPLGTKMTFVRDQVLADAGAFGVKGAEYDGNGMLIRAGENFRGEFGAYFKALYDKEIMKNVTMKAQLELFSNYLHNPQNIDVNADLLMLFKINKWMSASINWTWIYDDDIDIRTSTGTGPRLQFKSVLGLGLAYTIQNFVEEKK